MNHTIGMSDMNRHHLVLVKWLDSHRGDGWRSEPPDTDTCTVNSVGWLTAKSKHAIVISPHMTTDTPPQRCGEMTIPRCAVVSIKKIKI